MPQAKVLSNMDNFLGKRRKAGEIISAEEVDMLTHQTRDALVASKIIEVEGMVAPGAGMTAAESEAVQSLRASFDAFREEQDKRHTEILARLDALAERKGKGK